MATAKKVNGNGSNAPAPAIIMPKPGPQGVGSRGGKLSPEEYRKQYQTIPVGFGIPGKAQSEVLARLVSLAESLNTNVQTLLRYGAKLVLMNPPNHAQLSAEIGRAAGGGSASGFAVLRVCADGQSWKPGSVIVGFRVQEVKHRRDISPEDARRFLRYSPDDPKGRMRALNMAKRMAADDAFLVGLNPTENPSVISVVELPKEIPMTDLDADAGADATDFENIEDSDGFDQDVGGEGDDADDDADEDEDEDDDTDEE